MSGQTCLVKCSQTCLPKYAQTNVGLVCCYNGLIATTLAICLDRHIGLNLANVSGDVCPDKCCFAVLLQWTYRYYSSSMSGQICRLNATKSVWRCMPKQMLV